ncbi:MAG: thioesterase [Asgard group archaeon]|nr:thioesterase [Asgard group archaeon]
MDIELPKDLVRKEKFLVEEKHIADMLGSGKVAVLSTPSMILMMEHTAMNAAQEYLPEGWITVGTKVNIAHLQAAKKGTEVTAIAKLKEQDRKRLVFEVEVVLGDIVIGSGTHERFIVNKEKFMERLQ